MIKKYELLSKEDIELLEPYEDELEENELAQYVYSKGFYDKVFFWDYFLTNWKGSENADFHKKIHDYLDNEECFVLICPRWHAKTTTILINIVHSICYQLYWSQLYVASSGLWEISLWKVRLEFETNTIIRSVFGDLIPKLDKKTKEEFGAKKWRMKHLEFLNGETIETLSKGQPIRGRRPKRIIGDDLEENKDVETIATVRKTRQWFLTSLLWTLEEDDGEFNVKIWKIAVLWTIVGELCLVKHLRDDMKWKTMEYKAIQNSKPLWPWKWSLVKLYKRKRKMGSANFNQEYMNIPLSVKSRLIKEYWIRYWEVLPKEFDNIIMAIDPASETKEHNDFTWIAVVWVKGTKKYVLYCKGHKLSPNNLISMIKSINSRFKPSKIFFEKNKEATMAFLLWKNHKLPIEWFYAHTDKRSRLLSVSPDIEFWDVFFKNWNEHEKVISQLTNFPDVEHDDDMDALVYCLLNSEGEAWGGLVLAWL